MKIIFIADKNYEQYLIRSVKSYWKYNPSAKIIVVSEQPLIIPDTENIIIELPKMFRNRGIGDRITNTAYLKLFLTKLPYDKVLYVDCDTLCQAPLNDLWNTDCRFIALTESHAYGKKQAKAIGADKYGLTGMMLMNLKNLRKIGFTEKCLDVEQNYPTPETGWQHDETCINVAMRNRLMFVDHKWNYCHNRTYDNPIKESDAPILHFVGKDKKNMLSVPFYDDLPDLLSEIKDKSVAIVGNAKSLFDYSYGKEIDKADVVIRFNRGFPNDIKSQGKKTTILMLACDLSKTDINFYKAKYVINRSGIASNDAPTISSNDRNRLAEKLGSQPSSGFMAIDLCLTAHAKSIQLYGFDFEQTPTFYNPEGYKTKHDYNKEQEIVLEYERAGLLTINKGE